MSEYNSSSFPPVDPNKQQTQSPDLITGSLQRTNGESLVKDETTNKSKPNKKNGEFVEPKSLGDRNIKKPTQEELDAAEKISKAAKKEGWKIKIPAIILGVLGAVASVAAAIATCGAAPLIGLAVAALVVGGGVIAGNRRESGTQAAYAQTEQDRHNTFQLEGNQTAAGRLQDVQAFIKEKKAQEKAEKKAAKKNFNAKEFSEGLNESINPTKDIKAPQNEDSEPTAPTLQEIQNAHQNLGSSMRGIPQQPASMPKFSPLAPKPEQKNTQPPAPGSQGILQRQGSPFDRSKIPGASQSWSKSATMPRSSTNAKDEAATAGMTSIASGGGSFKTIEIGTNSAAAEGLPTGVSANPNKPAARVQRPKLTLTEVSFDESTHRHKAKTKGDKVNSIEAEMDDQTEAKPLDQMSFTELLNTEKASLEGIKSFRELNVKVSRNPQSVSPNISTMIKAYRDQRSNVSGNGLVAVAQSEQNRYIEALNDINNDCNTLRLDKTAKNQLWKEISEEFDSAENKENLTAESIINSRFNTFGKEKCESLKPVVEKMLELKRNISGNFNPEKTYIGFPVIYRNEDGSTTLLCGARNSEKVMISADGSSITKSSEEKTETISKEYFTKNYTSDLNNAVFVESLKNGTVKLPTSEIDTKRKTLIEEVGNKTDEWANVEAADLSRSITINNLEDLKKIQKAANETGKVVIIQNATKEFLGKFGISDNRDAIIFCCPTPNGRGLNIYAFESGGGNKYPPVDLGTGGSGLPEATWTDAYGINNALYKKLEKGFGDATVLTLGENDEEGNATAAPGEFDIQKDGMTGELAKWAKSSHIFNLRKKDLAKRAKEKSINEQSYKSAESLDKESDFLKAFKSGSSKISETDQEIIWQSVWLADTCTFDGDGRIQESDKKSCEKNITSDIKSCTSTKFDDKKLAELISKAVALKHEILSPASGSTSEITAPTELEETASEDVDDDDDEIGDDDDDGAMDVDNDDLTSEGASEVAGKSVDAAGDELSFDELVSQAESITYRGRKFVSLDKLDIQNFEDIAEDGSNLPAGDREMFLAYTRQNQKLGDMDVFFKICTLVYRNEDDDGNPEGDSVKKCRKDFQNACESANISPKDQENIWKVVWASNIKKPHKPTDDEIDAIVDTIKGHVECEDEDQLKGIVKSAIATKDKFVYTVANGYPDEIVEDFAIDCKCSTLKLGENSDNPIDGAELYIDNDKDEKYIDSDGSAVPVSIKIDKDGKLYFKYILTNGTKHTIKEGDDEYETLKQALHDAFVFEPVGEEGKVIPLQEKLNVDEKLEIFTRKNKKASAAAPTASFEPHDSKIINGGILRINDKSAYKDAKGSPIPIEVKFDEKDNPYFEYQVENGKDKRVIKEGSEEYNTLNRYFNLNMYIKRATTTSAVGGDKATRPADESVEAAAPAPAEPLDPVAIAKKVDIDGIRKKFKFDPNLWGDAKAEFSDINLLPAEDIKIEDVKSANNLKKKSNISDNAKSLLEGIEWQQSLLKNYQNRGGWDATKFNISDDQKLKAAKYLQEKRRERINPAKMAFENACKKIGFTSYEQKELIYDLAVMHPYKERPNSIRKDETIKTRFGIEGLMEMPEFSEMNREDFKNACKAAQNLSLAYESYHNTRISGKEDAQELSKALGMPIAVIASDLKNPRENDSFVFMDGVRYDHCKLKFDSKGEIVTQIIYRNSKTEEEVALKPSEVYMVSGNGDYFSPKF